MGGLMAQTRTQDYNGRWGSHAIWRSINMTEDQHRNKYEHPFALIRNT